MHQRPLKNPERVCENCVEDLVLASLLRDQSADGPCDFCGSQTNTGWFDAVIDRIRSALAQEWNIPEDELFPDNESETGWGGEVLNSREVLADIGYEPRNRLFHETVVAALGQFQFCERDYGFMRPTERWMAGWKLFKHVVKHQRRYTFWSMLPEKDEYEAMHPDYLAVGKMLDEVGTVVQHAGVIRTIPRGAGFWRVRTHDTGTGFAKDTDLSPPPLEKATQANRMSPAGVAMFYGAEDWDTACIETVDATNDSAKSVSGAVFETLRELYVLDLIDLPEEPSYFDVERTDTRHALRFLRTFAHDLAMPVARTDRTHIEYVPTQAFTEYVRYQLRTDEYEGLDGIRYRSSKNRKPCVVLFCGQAECINDATVRGHSSEKWLAMSLSSLRTEMVKDIEALKPSIARGGTS